MKKLFAMILALLMLLSLAACGQKETGTETTGQDAAEATTPEAGDEAQDAAEATDSEPIVGGWTMTEGAALTDEAKAAFEKALEGLTGVAYQPIAQVATQVVAGTNYCILCEARVVYPDAVPYYALVYIYADLNGGAELLNIAVLDIGDIAETGEIKAADEAPAALMGGWTVDRESSFEVEGGLMHLASQVVNGTNHCVLCEGGKLVFVYESLDGNTEVRRTVNLDPGSLNG